MVANIARVSKRSGHFRVSAECHDIRLETLFFAGLDAEGDTFLLEKNKVEQLYREQ
ncbi:hypothetical protein BNJ_00069 [Kaumoebavirus]|uniref:hypothetical protein n=1 Tax=Kaumoebavirus TaxID=1859492 RepID=UPI0009C36F23|nr:hypothetical protein BNJ_00069 [Kaumoebavirus]ARA71911.1 hypothetical protein BNJ_00069 [Kaumoebavirus]